MGILSCRTPDCRVLGGKFVFYYAQCRFLGSWGGCMCYSASSVFIFLSFSLPVSILGCWCCVCHGTPSHLEMWTNHFRCGRNPPNLLGYPASQLQSLCCFCSNYSFVAVAAYDLPLEDTEECLFILIICIDIGVIRKDGGRGEEQSRADHKHSHLKPLAHNAVSLKSLTEVAHLYHKMIYSPPLMAGLVRCSVFSENIGFLQASVLQNSSPYWLGTMKRDKN